mgnify:FL=1
METLFNGFTLEIPPGGFPLSTDSMVLAHFIKLPRSAKILDLGSGCGTLGVLLCARDPECTVTGFELTEHAHRAAQENIRVNGLQSRMESICADLRQIPEALPQGSFSLCVSNPPYFSGGPLSHRTPLARREDGCTLAELLKSAAWALKYGGDLYLVHRPERLGEIIALAAPFRLEAKRLGLLRHAEGQRPNLILLQLRKGGKPGLSWEEITLYDKSGIPTEEYRAIYHI